MTYSYADEGNHQLWTASHQGGSFSRVSRYHRFFLGSDNIYPAAGSDSFRLDACTLYPTAFALGTQIQSLTDTGGGARISTVGIVEDETAGLARYFFLRYNVENDLMKPTTLVAYDSLYGDEMSNASVSDVWEPMVDLWDFVEQSMRVVNLGVEGAVGQTYLFYLVPQSNRTTRLNVVPLPDPGDPVSNAPPLTVTTFDFEVIDRIYVVPHDDGRVFISVGNTERSSVHRTVCLGYEPSTQTIFQEPTMVVSDQLPFPRSYAACVGRRLFDELPIHLMLEPPSSWLQGAGASIDDGPNARQVVPPSYRKSTGNSWVITSLGPDGLFVEDSMPFDGSEVRPWMGSAHADSQGGRNRVSVVPKMLARIAPPPSAYEARKNIPEFDVSDSYAFQAQATVRQEGVLAETAFVYRYDFGVDPLLQPTFGNNRATSNVFDESPPDAPQGSPLDRRTLTTLLVPGTLLIESQRNQRLDDSPPIQTIATVANRLREWDLDDESTVFGGPESEWPGNLGTIGASDHDPSTDTIHGVQGDIFDPDLTIVVGWFINGRQPPP